MTTTYVGGPPAVGSAKWYELTVRHVKTVLMMADGDCRAVADRIPDLRKHVEGVGRNWSEFCAEELKSNADFIDRLLTVCATATGKVTATDVAAAQPHGGKRNRAGRPPKGKGKNQEALSLLNKRKHRSLGEKTIGRLKRDHPEVAAGIGTKYPTVAAAARAAGIARPKPTQLDKLKTAWRKATTAERRAFKRWVEKQ